MADAPAPAKAGGKKKVSATTWALAGGGVLALYFGYRYLRSRSAAGSSVSGGAATGLSGGGTVPATLTLPGTTTTAPTTFTAWLKRALATVTTGTYGNATFLNDLNAWLTGRCVSTGGFAALSHILGSLGPPPNRAGSTSSIVVCKTGATTTTPGGKPTVTHLTATTTKKKKSATTPPKGGTGRTITVTSIIASLGSSFHHISTLQAEPGGYGLGYHTGGLGAVQGLTGNVFQTFNTWAETLSAIGAGTPVYVMTGPGTVREFTTAASLTAYEKANSTATTTWRKLTPKRLAA